MEETDCRFRGLVGAETNSEELLGLAELKDMTVSMHSLIIVLA